MFEPFVEAYAEGETPNPDVACNRHIKFGALRRHAIEARESTPQSTTRANDAHRTDPENVWKLSLK